MTCAYAGSNICGTDGMIAVDKVANKVRFYDPVSLKEIKSFDAPEPAIHELAISPDRRMAYMPLYGDGIYGNNKKPNNKIVAIDIAAKALVDVFELGAEFMGPHGMVMSSAGDLWVVCDIPSKMIRVRPEKRSIEAVYDTPGRGPHVLTMLPDESRIYTSSKEGDVGVFDMTRRAFVKGIAVRGPGIESGNGSGSEAILPTRDGRRVLVIDNDTCDLRVIDTASNELIDRVPLKMFPFTNPKRSRLSKLAFSPDGRHLMASSFTGGLAWIIDPADLRSQTVISVAKGPQGINYAPDGRYAYVSSHDSGILTKVDLIEKRAVAGIDGGSGIEVFCWY